MYYGFHYPFAQPQARKQVARIVTVALVGITYFVVIIVTLHFLRPDLNPIQRPTSEYRELASLRS